MKKLQMYGKQLSTHLLAIQKYTLSEASIISFLMSLEWDEQSSIVVILRTPLDQNRTPDADLGLALHDAMEILGTVKQLAIRTQK